MLAIPDARWTRMTGNCCRGIVDQFYAGFKEVVKASPNHIADADWGMLTDGRVVSGRDAVKLGLIDEVGDLDSAIRKAKEMAKIEKRGEGDCVHAVG